MFFGIYLSLILMLTLSLLITNIQLNITKLSELPNNKENPTLMQSSYNTTDEFMKF